MTELLAMHLHEPFGVAEIGQWPLRPAIAVPGFPGFVDRSLILLDVVEL